MSSTGGQRHHAGERPVQRKGQKCAERAGSMQSGPTEGRPQGERAGKAVIQVRAWGSSSPVNPPPLKPCSSKRGPKTSSVDKA